METAEEYGQTVRLRRKKDFFFQNTTDEDDNG